MLSAQRNVGVSSLGDSEVLQAHHENLKSFRVAAETRYVAINSRQGADHARFFCGPT
jgi:hypothetical protein